MHAEAVYRVWGCGGGTWRASLLTRYDDHVVPFTTEHDRLGHPDEAVAETAQDIFIELLEEPVPDTITVYTNATLPQLALGRLPEPYRSRAQDVTVRIRSQEHATREPRITHLWQLSQFLWRDGRYDIKPSEEPEGPYTVYADASHRPDATDGPSCTVGFLIIGDNGGVIGGGFPAPADINDSNEAEYYAVEAALDMLPEDAKVEICTDNQAVSRLDDGEAHDSFPISKRVKKRLSNVQDATVNKVSRTLTSVADALADIGYDDPLTVRPETMLLFASGSFFESI